MTDFGFSLVILRVIVYIATIAAAGGVLFALSFPFAATEISRNIQRQVVFGCALLFAVEPVRYIAAQLVMAQGDWTLAFSAELRWVAMQTPIGQAAAVRLFAALALLWTLGLRSALARLLPAIAIIVSFLLEGHSASADVRSAFVSTVLLMHLGAAHWWLGSLCPLFRLTRQSDAMILVSTMEAFSSVAVWIVAALVIAGALLLGLLTNWTLRIDSAYQIRFALKLGLVVGLLSLAAWNKWHLVPLLHRDRKAGTARLAASIWTEMLAGLLILTATASAISSGPDD